MVGTRLATHPDVDLVLFTGAYDTAKVLARLTQDRPEPPRIIHCGGKGTAIVLDDAELDRAVYEVMVGAFLTAGQRHNSTGRVIVTDGIYDAFIGNIVEKSRALHVGSGFDPSVFMGPVISENLRTRYRRFSRSMAGQGHIPLLPPRARAGCGKGFYVRPCIIGVDWERGSPVLGGEPPGPTLLGLPGPRLARSDCSAQPGGGQNLNESVHGIGTMPRSMSFESDCVPAP